MRNRGTLSLWSAVALAAVVLASWQIRLPRGPGAGALNLDVDLYFYPLYEATYRRLAAGVLPLWNPYQLCGIPWLATLQAGVFYPLHALYLLVPLHVALAGSHLFHLPLAALATAAFARRAGLSRAAAWLAALLFALRGMFVLSLAAPNYVEATAWLPVGALAIVGLAQGRRAGPVALLATATAMSLLAGYPQPTAYALYGWATLLVAMLASERVPLRRWPTRAAIFACALAIGALAAGIQLAPALELVRDGAHRDLSAEAMAPFGISPAAVILGSQTIAGGPFSWGVTALALGGVAVLGRRRALAWWAIGMTALTALVSLGDHTPLFQLYRLLPFLGSFRFPDRILGLTDFVFAIAAAVGLDAITERAAPARRSASALALTVLVAVVVLARAGHAPAGTWTTITVAALVAVALLAIHLATTGRRSGVVAAGFVGLAAVEALLAPWRHFVTYTARTAQRYDTLAPAYRAVATRAGHDRAWFLSGVANLQSEHALKLATRFGVRTIDDYEPLAPRRQAQFFTYLSEGGLAYHRTPWLFAGEVATLAAPPGVAPPAARRRLLDLAAVRFVVLPPSLRATRPDVDAFVRDAGFEPRGQVGGALDLYENPHALPRAYVVHRTRSAPDPATLLAAIARDDFDPLTQSWVEGAPGFETTADAPRGVAAQVVIDEERVVEIAATLAEPGLVVLADAYYPGWQATVDGAVAPILPTNHLFRGVPAPAGTHRVRFEYRPRSLTLGIVASIIGWLAIAALALCARRAARA